MDESLPVSDMRSLDTALRERTWTWREYGGMFSIFAAMALFLAALGLYAVVAFSVNRRTKEFGVRMALGASRRTVLGLVFAQGMRHVVIGLIVGVAGAFWLTRILSSLLIGVEPVDPISFAAVATVLTIAGALGCVLLPMRATSVDQIVVLKNE